MSTVFGVTVLPEWPQSEGIDAVLDRLQEAGVTAVATSPYVMEPSPDGVREPPADADAGKVRLLDRPLWGHRAIKVRTSPSFAPDPSLYEGLPYQPATPDGLTAREGETVARFIAGAKARGMAVHLQVQAAIPPGYRVQFGGPLPEDQPLGPDGRPVTRRVDLNASLASPAILAYGRALLTDLARAYPDVDAIRIDWPEYPPYAFGALFFDFSPHALRAAEAHGIDIAPMQADMLALRDVLATGLTDGDLAIAGEAAAVLAGEDLAAAAARLEALLSGFPGVVRMLELKRRLVRDLLAAYRAALPNDIALVPQAFPPPFTLVSGFDFSDAAGIAQGLGVKLYTMHWPMMVRNWAEAMTAQNPKVSPDRVVAALAALTGTMDGPPGAFEDVRYPEPHEPHTAGERGMAAKIRAARAAAGEGCPVHAFGHGYGPAKDVARRASIAWEASEGRLWMNRYGYLSDEKFALLREIVRGS